MGDSSAPAHDGFSVGDLAATRGLVTALVLERGSMKVRTIIDGDVANDEVATWADLLANFVADLGDAVGVGRPKVVASVHDAHVLVFGLRESQALALVGSDPAGLGILIMKAREWASER